MNSNKLREKFLNFFEKKGHKIVPSSSLLPADPSVLFTTAGMQQFKPYYLGEKSPYGSNVASSQKCFRTSDIEEVGDESHLTFLEMLGNFSFGGYFKEEAIKLAYEFIFEELKISLNDAIFTVFEGDKDVPEDKESIEIWKKLGIKESQIKKCGREDNFWGPTGQEGPCGPTTEIHIKGTEVWNLVFNEYFMDKDKKLTSLKQKGVDTGMGLERLAMVVQAKNSVYETDLFEPMVTQLRKQYGATSSGVEKMFRIIVDHIRGSVFLIADGVLPLNVERGYVLRRILRRILARIDTLKLPPDIIYELVKWIIVEYQRAYPELKRNENDVLTIIQKEKEKFDRMEKEGEKEFNKTILKLHISDSKTINGKDAFDLYQNYGFPIERIKELAEECGLEIDEKGFKEEFQRHQEVSRAGMEKKFKGGLADIGEQVVKYHTTTHLLLAALREILGPEIYQKGSNITAERLRFDFNYPEKLTEERIKKVEELVNQKIQENIKVEMMELPKNEALKIAKVSFDPAKYGEIVKVYKINNFSIEMCGGPHVEKTGNLGSFKIVKEESSGAGIRRIRAVLK